MKNLKTTIFSLTFLLTTLCLFNVTAQNKFDFGIFASSTCNQMEIRIKPNYTGVGVMTNVQFSVKWPVSSGITSLTNGAAVSPYFMDPQYVLPNFPEPLIHNGYYYQVWVNIGQGNISFIANQEYVIQTFSYSGSVSPIFEIAHDDFVINDINGDFYYELGADKTGSLYNASAAPISGRWLGTTNSDWNTASNWCGGVPIATTDVIIPAASSVPNSPTLSALSLINSLNVSIGGQLTIASNGKLSVTNELNNNATLGVILKSTVLGTGSLITLGNISGSGTFKVEKFITQGAGTRYNYVSMPVTAALTNVFYMYYMYKFNEPTNSWLNMYINNPMEVFRGYAVTKNITTDTKEYTGMVNNGLMGTANNITRASDSTGWNLVGNPYPSAIDWDAVNGWTKTNVYDAIYTWNQTLNTYASYVSGIGVNDGTNIIPAMQGFMVRVASNYAFGTLQMNNAVRVHWVENMYKNNLQNVLRLTVEDENFRDETLIRFNSESTNQFDSKCDAQKMMSSEADAQLYTLAGNENLSINSLPEIAENLSVPLHLKILKNGIYSIKASELGSFDQGVYIYLEDLKLHSLTNLKEIQTYNFEGSIVDDEARFLVHFDKSPLNINNENQSSIAVYSFAKSLHINTIENAKGSLVVYNVLGEQIFASALENTPHNVFNLENLTSGYYMVKIFNGNEVHSEKVILK